MAKVRDSNAPKMILGVCWDVRAIAGYPSPNLVGGINGQKMAQNDKYFFLLRLTSPYVVCCTQVWADISRLFFFKIFIFQ